ncbi:MAG: hypothetical protein QGF67_15065 [Lentisphaeria bacterium]|jgi:hypothetical protein|nr:hypothetical protein [Lentisphaeria bacterium]MDP7742760.1 hypothetical protein [Lentisphaeria bacterium]
MSVSRGVGEVLLKIVAAMQSATEAPLNESNGRGNEQSLDNPTDAVTVFAAPVQFVNHSTGGNLDHAPDT